DPGNLADRGDLGMVLYRQGRYREAISSLEPAVRAHTDPVDRARWQVFLAMSQHRLGNLRAAQESYDRARSNLVIAKPSPTVAEEFARLSAEAEATLRIASNAP